MTIRTLSQGVYYDQALNGFGVRIGKKRRTFFVQKGAARLRTSLGSFPATSLAEARRRAIAITGENPASTLSLTFSEARTLFFEAQHHNLKASSRKEQIRILTKHFTWSKALDKITHHDIGNAIDAIEAPSEANHAFKDIRTFFNWCVPRYLKRSPCDGLKMPHKSTSRSRVLSDDEIAKVWIAADQCGTFGIIVKLLILTGQRRNEIASLKTDYIDLDNKTICLPSSLTKNKREHLFPVAKLAISMLEQHITKSGLFFPARGTPNKLFSGWSKSKAALDKASGVTDWVLHDLRRSYATNMARLGVPLHVIERLLNHVSGSFGGIVGVYQHHQFMDEMREAVAKYEAHIVNVVNHDEP